MIYISNCRFRLKKLYPIRKGCIHVLFHLRWTPAGANKWRIIHNIGDIYRSLNVHTFSPTSLVWHLILFGEAIFQLYIKYIMVYITLLSSPAIKRQESNSWLHALLCARNTIVFILMKYARVNVLWRYSIKIL